MEPGKILHEIHGGTARITLSNPGRLNALDGNMVTALRNLVREINDDPQIRVVILKGAGGNFSAGADLGQLVHAGPMEALDFHLRMNETSHLIRNSRKIFITALEGYALGGGFELSLSTDIRICTEGAILGQPEIGVGLNAGAGGNAILPRVVGRSNALYMSLTGVKLKSDEALRMGIVQRVVPDSEIEEELEKLAETIMKAPEVSTALLKLSINNSLESPIDEAMVKESMAFALLNGEKEVKKRISGFLEKEKK